jgi:NAD(P)H-hydrate epimerase
LSADFNARLFGYAMSDSPTPIISAVSQQLPTALYRAADSRELDRLAIERMPIAGIELMHRAARAAFAALLSRWPEPLSLQIYCGTGNNGGDGFVIAALAQLQKIPVTVYTVGAAEKFTADAQRAYQFARDSGVLIKPFDRKLTLENGIIVDALLGTGLRGDVEVDYRAAMEQINHSGLPVVAVDIPSGLCADTGRVLGAAVIADLTVTFIALKAGLLTGAAPDYVGELLFADLAVSETIYAAVQPVAQRIDVDVLPPLPLRARTAHKGDFGHVLVVGGDYGFAGAPLMAASASARIGAGLTSVATRLEHVAAMVAAQPELMAHPVRSGQELELLLAAPSVLIVGPGLGRSPWSEQLLQWAAMSNLPMVLDADGLNMLAAGRPLGECKRDNWILTPHPGEAARILNVSTADVQADRFAAVRNLQQRYGGVIVLKGAGTLICDGENIALCNDGNPGMGSGGMGDVLSGVIGGLLAQADSLGLSTFDVACYGVALHARAADLAADQDGERGLLATDLLPQLRHLVNDYVQ